MRVLTGPMQALLNTDGIAALATFWLVTRKDGVMIGLTDWTSDVRTSGVTYQAHSGLTRSAMQERVDLSVPNVETTGLLSADNITDEDIRAGKYDGAQIRVFMAVPTDPDFLSYGRIALPGFYLGEITILDGAYVAEVRGLSYALQQGFVDIYAPTCSANFADLHEANKCKLDPANFTFEGVVAVGGDPFTFDADMSAAAVDFFAHGFSFTFGVITFTSGLNTGLVVEVGNSTQINPATFTLYLPAPRAIFPGDTFDALLGCDKTINTCLKYANVPNFRGTPFVPGLTLLFDYGETVP